MSVESTLELTEYCEAKISTNENSPEDLRSRILSELDIANKDIISGGAELNLDDAGQPVRRPQEFPWAKSLNPQVIKVEAAIKNRNATATNGSKNVTLSSTYPTSLAGFYIKFLTNDVVYKIATHTGGSASLVLTEEFTETGVALESAHIFKLDYTFTGVLVPLSKIRFRTKNKVQKSLDMLDKEAFQEKYPLNEIDEGIPTIAGSMVQDDSYNFTISLNAYPENISTISLDYIEVPATLALTPSLVNSTIPKHHRVIIGDLVCYRMMKELDDDRADMFFKAAKRRFDALVTESQQFKNKFDSKFGRINLANIAPRRQTPRFMKD